MKSPAHAQSREHVDLFFGSNFCNKSANLMNRWNSSQCLLMSYVSVFLSFAVNCFSVDAIRLPPIIGVV